MRRVVLGWTCAGRTGTRRKRPRLGENKLLVVAKMAYLKVDFVVIVRARSDAVGLESLAHFQIPQGSVGERSDALGICGTNGNLCILDEIADVWDDVLGKDGDV